MQIWLRSLVCAVVALVGATTLAAPAHAQPPTVLGVVTDHNGEPVSGARVWFSSSYDARTDDAGRYSVTVGPGEHDVRVWLPDDVVPASVAVGSVSVTSGETKVYDIRLPDTNQRPKGRFTWARSAGRLVVGGSASDDASVLQVRVAVRNQATGQWLHRDQTWGRYAVLPAVMTNPGASATSWKLKRFLRPGRYGVSLEVVDDERLANATPRPWRTIVVTG